MEVGGAYAHIFFALLDFLELRTLIITDLDSVTADRKACPVHQGDRDQQRLSEILVSVAATVPRQPSSPKTTPSKVEKLRRIAYQRPEAEGGPCGRTFEDAFMLANPAMFGIEGDKPDDQAQCAWHQLNTIKKSEFALKHAIDNYRLVPRRATSSTD